MATQSQMPVTFGPRSGIHCLRPPKPGASSPKPPRSGAGSPSAPRNPPYRPKPSRKGRDRDLWTTVRPVDNRRRVDLAAPILSVRTGSVESRGPEARAAPRAQWTVDRGLWRVRTGVYREGPAGPSQSGGASRPRWEGHRTARMIGRGKGGGRGGGGSVRSGRAGGLRAGSSVGEGKIRPWTDPGGGGCRFGRPR